MSRKLTTEEFIKNAINVHGEKYSYSKSEYCNNHTKLIIICKQHGEFQQTPANHCQGVGCPKCYGTPKSTTSEFIDKSRKIHGDKFLYDKVDYTDAHKKVTITCLKHGDFQQKPNNHLNGVGCIKCAGLNPYSTSEFIEKSKSVHGKKYDYFDTKYERFHAKVTITCRKHGAFRQKPSDHLAGCGCPKCNESHMERDVRLYLTSTNIQYKQEHKFSSCKNKRPLPFDFVAFHNKKLHAIECQGIQHYELTFFSKNMTKEQAQRSFEIMQLNDKIKREWCLKHDIPLLEIPYYKSPEPMITEFLKIGASCD